MVECLEFRIENTNPTGLDSGSLKVQRFSSPLHYGKFVFPQLQKGQGITLANSIRRVLLYDVGGVGITHLRARLKKLPASSHVRGGNTHTGVLHEFSSIPGMRESVLELLVNLRAVVWRSIPNHDENTRTKVGTPKTSSPEIGLRPSPHHLLGKIHTFSLKKTLEEAKNSHVENERAIGTSPRPQRSFILQAKHLRNDSIVNPDHYLATILIDECPDFEIDYILGASLQNFDPMTFSSDQSPETNEFHSVWLPTDGNFFPVKKVNYSIEENSVGIGSTSGSSSVGSLVRAAPETVFLEIWTNGALHPQESVDQALGILLKLFGGAKDA